MSKQLRETELVFKNTIKSMLDGLGPVVSYLKKKKLEGYKTAYPIVNGFTEALTDLYKVGLRNPKKAMSKQRPPICNRYYILI